MPASLVSLLTRPFRAIARRIPASAPPLRWSVEGGVSAAVWTAPDAGTETVSSIRFEIRSDGTARQPFVLIVSPENYVPLSFPVGDLEKAHELALRQLAVACRLPAVPAAAPITAATLPAEPSHDTALFQPANDPAAESSEAA